MKHMLLAVLSVVLYCSSNAQIKYPLSRIVDSSDTYFGITYHDPYRWLEGIARPEVQTWFKDQNTQADSMLNRLNGRDSLVAEWTSMDKIRAKRFNVFLYEGGRLFYRKTLPSEHVAKLYYRQGTNGKEVLLFDPVQYKPGASLSMTFCYPSYDGKMIAIAYSQQGAEVSTLKIMNVDTHKFLPDSLFPVVDCGGWTFDNKAILYNWIKSADNKDPASRLNSKTKLHRVGSGMDLDKDFFSTSTYPELHMDSTIYPFAFLSEDAPRYIFSGESSVQSEIKMYYAPAETMRSAHVPWKVLCTPADKLVRTLFVKGNDVYAISYKDAPNYKVVASTLNHPDWSKPIIIAPERTGKSVQSMAYSKNYLFITYTNGVNNFLSKYDFRTRETRDVKLPFDGTLSLVCYNTKTDSCLIGITSWTRPFSEFWYDAATDRFQASSFNKTAHFPDQDEMVSEEVEVKGHDGVMIPLSIIHKKNLSLDGSHPCLMESYGAYGSSMLPGFSYTYYSLARRNCVIAVPHVRGGSEHGEAWYRAGFKATKPNTWKDFISCAEYLINKGYTSASRLAGTGTSAGGILISRSITERPDLFAAAVCNVGCANAMRLEFGANGPVNIPEFGSVKDSAECRALFEMDGMQHVVKGTRYPAVICVGGWNDPRVIAWQPGKFAASLQNASASGKPVIMKVNYDNGHFTEDKIVSWTNFANQMAFVMWQCGHPDFQPKN